MKVIQVDGDRFTFEFSNREKHWFSDILRYYPLIPASHHRLSKAGVGVETDSNQKLLDEALAERKAANKRELQALLNEAGRFRRSDSGFHVSLSAHELEWILQVLNDVRVGSWIGLGEPDDMNRESIEITPDNSANVWAMEICGYFQSVFLAAMEAR